MISSSAPFHSPELAREIQKIKQRVTSACETSRNKHLFMCKHVNKLIAAGDKLVQRTNHTALWVDNDKHLTAIITDPSSKEFCEQSIYLDALVGSEFYEHTLGYNIKEILALHRNKYTYLCDIPFPSEWNPQIILKKIFHRLKPEDEYAHLFDPLRKVQYGLWQILLAQKYYHHEVSLKKAAELLLDVALSHKKSLYFNQWQFKGIYHILEYTVVRNIPPIWIYLGCEPERLIHAQRMMDHGTEPLVALYTVSKIKLADVAALSAILTKQISVSHQTAPAPSDHFNKLTPLQLYNTLRLIEDFHFKTNAALELTTADPEKTQQLLEGKITLPIASNDLALPQRPMLLPPLEDSSMVLPLAGSSLMLILLVGLFWKRHPILKRFHAFFQPAKATVTDMPMTAEYNKINEISLRI